MAGLICVGSAASMASSERPRTHARLYSYDTILERLPPHLKHVAFELGPLIEEEDAVGRTRHLAGPGDLPAVDHADIGDGVMRGATRARRDDRGVAAFPSPPLGVPSGCRRSATGLITRDSAGAAFQSETGVRVMLGDSSLLVADI
jgi:hypothetical protein